MRYDVAIIGGGPGGYVAAIKAAQLGGKVLLIEKEILGGVCLNKGCIPTKTLLKCSGTYRSIKEAAAFGIKIDGMTVDFKAMMNRKQDVVKKLTGGIKSLLKSNGVEVVTGEGKVADASHVTAGGKTFEAGNIIIATGSRPFMPQIKGINSANVLDSDALLSMNEIPESIAIIGGGVIGVEFAVLLSELGCRVTVIEMMDDIMFMADQDVIKEIAHVLNKNGIEIITSAKVTEIGQDRVIYRKDGQSSSVICEKVLVAAGRIPNTDTGELERLGIKHTNGRIITGERMQTSVSHIYAIGDVNGKYMLAHVASEEGIVAVENIFGNNDAVMSYGAIPQCVYTHPEIAWVGLTEKAAKEKGYDVSVGIFPAAANGKSQAEGETSGFVKVITDKLYNEILGVHMVCSHATDMVAEAVLAINTESTANEIASCMHPHPTVSEALMEAAKAAAGRAIHI